MLLSRETLKAIERYEGRAWARKVVRHVLGENPPDRPNVRGARWNPHDVPALYASLEEATAIAEGDHLLNQQPIRPRIKRGIATIEISLESVIDLSSAAALTELGITDEDLSAPDMQACQAIGGAVAWLGHDGLMVPSARHRGVNLVVYTANLDDDYPLEVLEVRPLE